MAEIIPAILAKDFDEVKEKIKLVEDYARWVQLDVADGDFAPNITWGDPRQLKYYDPGVLMEVHLMISKPESVIRDWVKSGVKRIYFHYEATSQHEEIISIIKKNKLEAGIAILPDTPLDVVLPIIKLVDAVLIFSGSLGFYGGAFNEKTTLTKISALRKAEPDIIIEVDGGMNPETAKKVVEAGANAIVAGSYIFESKDAKKAIEELKSITKK